MNTRIPEATGPSAHRDRHAPRAVTATDLALPGKQAGKVRDTYGLPASAMTKPSGDGAPRMLLVATDRVSAFDVVMPTPIPGKGILLTRISDMWMGLIERSGIIRTHRTHESARDLRDHVFKPGATARADLEGRSTIALRARTLPIECVVRGYLEGSGWKEYQACGSVCGVRLRPGLTRCDRLPEPILTPATKEAVGTHDVNISYEEACSRVGRGVMDRLREASLLIYRLAAAHADARGLILADTKFEFGIPTGEPEGGAGTIMLIDEALTPDSSRFWRKETYAPGRQQESFDKQFLREYLETLAARGVWNKAAPGPTLPEEVIAATRERYESACDLLGA